jgi:hypothetical protein
MMKEITLLCSFFTLFSCSAPGNNPEEEIDLPSQFFPISIGNRWVYQDSTWWGDSISVNYDTISIIDTLLIENEIWYEKRSYQGVSGFPFGTAVYSSNDTVYSFYQIWYDYGKTKEFFPPSIDPLTYYIKVHDALSVIRTASQYEGTIETAAGIFTNPALFTDDLDNGRTIFIAPGIGPIKTTLFGRISTQPDKKIERLVYYKLLNDDDEWVEP